MAKLTYVEVSVAHRQRGSISTPVKNRKRHPHNTARCGALRAKCDMSSSCACCLLASGGSVAMPALCLHDAALPFLPPPPTPPPACMLGLAACFFSSRLGLALPGVHTRTQLARANVLLCLWSPPPRPPCSRAHACFIRCSACRVLVPAVALDSLTRACANTMLAVCYASR